MHNWNIEEAVYQISLSRRKKQSLVPWWSAAEQYFNNTILDTREYDPSKLLSPRVKKRWGIDNLIPDAVRAYAAWVVSSSFDVMVEPLGDVSDQVRFIAARTLLEQIEFYRKQPQFTQLIRDIAIRTKLFNIVAQVDGWDDKLDEPYSRLVTHNDLFIDPTAWGNVNESNGPRWIAIKYMLSADEVIGRYGSLKGLEPGIISRAPSDDSRDDETPDEAFHNKYEIYEWMGIDESEVEISEDEMQSIVIGELQGIQNGTFMGPDPDINHADAIAYGDLTIISSIEDQFPDVRIEGVTPEEEIMEALQFLASIGNGQIAEAYSQWRMSHQEFIDAGQPGGTRPKYPGYIYHADFQIGQDEPLIGPEVCDYPHFQLPVSVYRSHMNTGGLFGLGAMPEVLALQQDLEWWHKCEMDHAHYSARPPFMIDTDILDPRYRKSGGMQKLVNGIRKGFDIIYLRGAKLGAEPHFANVGTFSVDVRRIIDYIRYRIQEVIGPTPILRGNVSGEASGKQVAMRQESAAKPITDTLSIIEGPLQKHFERMVLNILEFSPIEKIEQISGPEGAAAIAHIRENLPDFRCSVSVDLGTGMPTDWHSKMNIGMMLLQMGLADPKELGEKLNLPFSLNLPAPEGGPTAPVGANQNTMMPGQM